MIPGSERSPAEGKDTHSNIFAWKIPWTEEPGGLQLDKTAVMNWLLGFYLKVAKGKGAGRQERGIGGVTSGTEIYF